MKLRSGVCRRAEKQITAADMREIHRRCAAKLPAPIGHRFRWISDFQKYACIGGLKPLDELKRTISEACAEIEESIAHDQPFKAFKAPFGRIMVAMAQGCAHYGHTFEDLTDVSAVREWTGLRR